MPKYSVSVEDLLSTNKELLTPKEILMIGIQILNGIKYVHKVGYTHNDLKPANFMIDQSRDLENNNFNVSLIDFGFASNYVDKKGKHLEIEELD